jgi:acyl-CoA reductase-like NAD-dependent aldehyde dehydrogenase
MSERLQNFIDGAWRPSAAAKTLNVLDPASAKVLAQVPLSPAPT